jgi:hypothetical protein
MARKKSEKPKPRPILDVAPPAEAQKSSKLKLSALTPVKTVVVLLVLLAGILIIRQYMQTRNELVLNDPSKLSAHIGAFLELPTGETPTLATVNEASKLKSQPFFRNAQDGDKVLIYSQASRAVLYRPSTKKIIEYSPINLGASKASDSTPRPSN